MKTINIEIHPSGIVHTHITDKSVCVDFISTIDNSNAVEALCSLKNMKSYVVCLN